MSLYVIKKKNTGIFGFKKTECFVVDTESLKPERLTVADIRQLTAAGVLGIAVENLLPANVLMGKGWLEANAHVFTRVLHIIAENANIPDGNILASVNGSKETEALYGDGKEPKKLVTLKIKK